MSKIEWTDETWNPVTGCIKISPGCDHCYAERLAMRLKAMGQQNYRNGFAVTIHPHMLELPLRWKKPRRVFVNSMSDLFHADIPEQFVLQIFDVMRAAKQHTFQILTKRSKRLLCFDRYYRAIYGAWPENVWMGVSVENQDCTRRIDDLRDIGAAVRFLSMEPLIESIPNLDLRGIDWVIVGGESGPGAREIRKSWVVEILDQCRAANVPFFFKQWGGNKKLTGRTLDGRTFDEMPKGKS